MGGSGEWELPWLRFLRCNHHEHVNARRGIDGADDALCIGYSPCGRVGGEFAIQGSDLGKHRSRSVLRVAILDRDPVAGAEDRLATQPNGDRVVFGGFRRKVYVMNLSGT